MTNTKDMTKAEKIMTQNFIEQLEAGVAPWTQPWTSVMPKNAKRNKAYRGANVISLWSHQMQGKYDASLGYLSAKEIKELGGDFSGVSPAWVFFQKPVTRVNKDTGKAEPAYWLPKRWYTVFPVALIKGLPERFYKSEVKEIEIDQSLVTTVLDRLNLKGGYNLHGSKACYRPSDDSVTMPTATTFRSGEDYVAVGFHEAAHATGHESRLARKFGAYASEEYAFEELVAELSAAFSCARLGVAGKLQHAEYIGSWIRILKEGHNVLFKAASKAAAATNLLLPDSNKVSEDDEE